MLPVNDKKIQTHAENAVRNLKTIQHLLDCVVEGEVVDLRPILITLLSILEYSFEITVVDHGHGAGATRVPTISVKLVLRILQPGVALLFYDVLVHQNVINNGSDLDQFQSIEQLAPIELVFLEYPIALDVDNYRCDDGLQYNL